MAWGMGTAMKIAKYAGKGAKTAGKFGMDNLKKAPGHMNMKSAGNLAKGTAANAALTGVMFGGMGVMEGWDQDAGDKIGTASKWGTAAAIDIASDTAWLGASLAVGAVTGGVGFAAMQGFDMVTDMMGLDLSTAYTSAIESMDDSYTRLGAASGGSNYQMSRGSAQAMQRQIANLQGSGSNVAEMMHN